MKNPRILESSNPRSFKLLLGLKYGLIFIVLALLLPLSSCEKESSSKIEEQSNIFPQNDDIDLIKEWEEKGFVLLTEDHPKFVEIMAKLGGEYNPNVSIERGPSCSWAHLPDDSIACGSALQGGCEVFLAPEDHPTLTACIVCNNPGSDDHGNSTCF